MHDFDVYRHPRYGFQTVRRGFSWLAFLLPSLWAVRRGLGFTTLLLVSATSLVFDLAEASGIFIDDPAMQLVILLFLALTLGYKPGVHGYRWHARALEEDAFEYRCTVAARNGRQAIRTVLRKEKGSE